MGGRRSGSVHDSSDPANTIRCVTEARRIAEMADMAVNDTPQQSDAAALEAHIRAVTEAAERAGALLRALAPLRAHLAALESAVSAVAVPATATTAGHEPPAPAATLPAGDHQTSGRDTASAVAQVDDTGLSGEAMAAVEAQAASQGIHGPAVVLPPTEEATPNDAMPAIRPGDDANGNTPPPAARTGRTVTVTVTREDSPLDLVRVHAALDQLEGVTSLTLVSYTRGRAVLQMEADRPIDELPLTEGLGAAFPEGVTAHQQGPDDILMAIGTG
jgi:hypothetical protein